MLPAWGGKPREAWPLLESEQTQMDVPGDACWWGGWGHQPMGCLGRDTPKATEGVEHKHTDPEGQTVECAP